MSKQPCITRDDLSELLAGRLTNESDQTAAEHVDGCAKCQEIAVAIAEESPTSAFQLLDEPTDFEREPECLQTVDLIRELHADMQAETLPLSATVTWSGGGSRGSNEMPEMLGRYRLIRPLGRGGMGTVYLAHDTQLDRQVAVKVPEFGAGPHAADAIRRFYREARAMAAIQHPNLCPIFDVGEADGRPFITMGYIEGRTLAERLSEGGPMDSSEACQLIQALALAMEAVHQAGVVHRDLKPSNVMINEAGQPFITDFGLAARDHIDEIDLTASGAVLGTPAYMAPEQVRGQNDLIGPHTDVYALGVIFYQLLSGQRPFRGSKMEVLGEIVSGVRPKPLTQYAGVAREHERICSRAMATEISARYQSASALADALDGLSADDTNVAEKKRRPAVIAAALAALIACVLFGFWAAGLLSRSDRADVGNEETHSSDANSVTENGVKQTRKNSSETLQERSEATMLRLGLRSPPFVTPADQWVEILPLVETSRDSQEGTFQRTPDGVRLSAQDLNNRLLMPVHVSGDYEVEIEATRRGGGVGLSAWLPTAGQDVSIGLCGFTDGSTSGINFIDGQPGDQNASTRRLGDSSPWVRGLKR